MKYIIPTSSAEHLGKKIDKQIRQQGIINAQVIFPKRNKDGERYFPDEEVYSSIPEAEEGLFNREHVILLHSGQRKPNAGIREYEYNLEILQEYCSPGKLDLFFAHIPYGRQDKKFLPGEIAKVEKDFDKLKIFYKIEDIYIIDAHFAGRSYWDCEKRPFIDVKGSKVIMEKIKKDFLNENVLFLGPDIGAQIRAGIDGTEKKREGSYSVEISSEKELVDLIKKHDFISAIDDFSETGGTMVTFREFCKEINPASVLIAGLTHGVKQKGINRTKEQYDHFYLGNTVQRKEANVDFTELIMQSLGII
jgi:phosphoribosylpyrophosphate synthetase